MVNDILNFIGISLTEYNIDDNILFIVSSCFLLLVLCYFLSMFETLIVRFFRVK